MGKVWSGVKAGLMYLKHLDVYQWDGLLEVGNAALTPGPAAPSWKMTILFVEADEEQNPCAVLGTGCQPS